MDAVVLDGPATSPDPTGSGESRFRVPPARGGVRLFRLPTDLLLVESRAGTEAGGATEVLLDGTPLPAPVCALLLRGADAVHHLALARASGFRGKIVAVTVRRGGVVVGLDRPPAALGTRDLLTFADGLPSAERARLLRFLAATCAPLFRLTGHPGFAQFLLRLAHRSRDGKPVAVATPLTRGDAPVLSLWSVPGTFPDGPWHLLTRRDVARVAAPLAGTLVLDGAGADLRDAVLLPPPGRDVGAGLPIPLARGRGPLPGMLAPGGDHGSQRAVAVALARRAAVEPSADRAARLLRDRRLLAPALPVRRLEDGAHPVGGAVEAALSDGAGGVFVAGWLRDPLGLVTGGLALRDPGTGTTQAIPAARLHRIARPDLAERLATALHGAGGAEPGFVAHLPEAERAAGGPVPQWLLDLRLASGEAVELTAPPGLLPSRRARDLVLRAVHPGALRPRLLDECLTPAVARLQAATLATLGRPEVVRIGAARGTARVAVVVPLYRNLRFLRFQVAAFARDPDFRAKAHLVLVLDSPEQRAEVDHLLRGLHAVHGLPMTLVVMAENAGYAPACNAGLAEAGGAEQVLLLNSDVVPDAPGWLAALRRPMAHDRAVLATGPKLLFEDGSVQHAGLFFLRHGPEGDWLNAHHGKGLPRHHPSVCRAKPVPGVTGAALLVRREALEAVGGLCTDYVVGDYEDSDLCLRLRALGGEIRYVPGAELYHFERQSIAGHAGYARTLACAHNRRLHHLRWDGQIEAVMRRFAPDGAARAA